MRIFGLFLILFLVATRVSAQEESVGKSYSKSFDKEEVKELVISNQYGSIEIVQSDDEQIKVKAEISVMAKTMRKADELIDYIDIIEQQEEGYLTVATEFNKNISFTTTFKGVTVAVDYQVTVPEGVKVRIINSNGSVFLEDFEGELTVDIKSCSFRAAKLKGEFAIKQAGGDFSAEEVDYMDGEFKNTTLTLEEGYDVKLNLSGGKSDIKTVEKLSINSSGGTVELGEIEQMTGSATGTKYEVSDIGDVLKMDMKRGSINVRNIHFDFASVEIKASYTKIGLTFMKGAGYQLELIQNKGLKTDIPRNFRLTEQPTTEKGIVLKTGFVGDKKRNARVFLNLRQGNIFIQ